nr:MAG TPA: hypothetical protein [Bacteriophage sp.]
MSLFLYNLRIKYFKYFITSFYNILMMFYTIYNISTSLFHRRNFAIHCFFTTRNYHIISKISYFSSSGKFLEISRCAVYISRNIYYHFLIIYSCVPILRNWNRYVNNFS